MNARKFGLVTILAASAAFGGCTATPYQPAQWDGGYLDAHIRDNIYYVEFSGNGFTTTTTAALYFERRAREVCEENGYSDYRVSQERDTTMLQGVDSGTGSVALIPKPGFAGYVECLI